MELSIYSIRRDVEKILIDRRGPRRGEFVELPTHVTFSRIREMRGLSQQELAYLMQCSLAEVILFESTEEPDFEQLVQSGQNQLIKPANLVQDDDACDAADGHDDEDGEMEDEYDPYYSLVDAFRKALGIKTFTRRMDIDIFDADKDIDAWMETIAAGNAAKAEILQKKIIHDAEYMFCLEQQFSAELLAKYMIASLSYHLHITKDMAEHDRLLRMVLDDLQYYTQHDLYRLFSYLGDYLYAYRQDYSEASSCFEYAKILSNELHMPDVRLYIKHGQVYMEMGLFSYAANSFDKGLRLAAGAYKLNDYAYIQRQLNACNGLMGRASKSIKKIDAHIREEQAKENTSQTLAELYMDKAKIYYWVGLYDEAEENVVAAVKHCDKQSELFMQYHCYRTSILVEKNRKDLAIPYIAEIIPKTKEGSLWRKWLMAIRHVATLEDPASVENIIKVSIPALKEEHGKYDVVKELYGKLSGHFKEKGMVEEALKYKELEWLTFEKFMKLDFPL